MPPEPVDLIRFVGLVLPVSLISIQVFSQRSDISDEQREEVTGYAMFMAFALAASGTCGILSIVFPNAISLVTVGYICAGIALWIPLVLLNYLKKYGGIGWG